MEILFNEPECSICFVCDMIDMSIPFKVVLDMDTKILNVVNIL